MPRNTHKFPTDEEIMEYHEKQRQLIIDHYFIGYERCKKEAKKRGVEDENAISSCAHAYASYIMRR